MYANFLHIQTYLWVSATGRIPGTKWFGWWNGTSQPFIQEEKNQFAKKPYNPILGAIMQHLRTLPNDIEGNAELVLEGFLK